MVKLLNPTNADGAAWTLKAVEVLAVLVTKDTVAAALRAHLDAVAP